MLGIVYIILACFLWGTDALFRYPLVWGGISAVKLVFYEHLILTMIFIPFFFKHRERFYKTTVAEIFYFFIVGGIGSALATVSFTQAFALLNPSQVILFQKFQPVIAIFLARFVLGESLSGKFIFWAIFCLAGAFMISYPDLGKIGEEDFFSKNTFMGYFWVAISVLGWGAATVFGKKLSDTYTNTEVMCGRFLMAFVCLLPFIISIHQELNLTFTVAWKILVMVLLSGLLAMYFYYKGLGKISAKTCALTELFFPFSAVIVNWIFLGQSLTEIQLIGGGLLLLGSSIIQLNHY
ncbi:MAG: DMT family transporter [Bacteriovoracaceae bacterium]